MHAQSARIEGGQVHLPRRASWLDDFRSELLQFPHGRYDDQVDSLSQFFNWVPLIIPGPINTGSAIFIFAAEDGTIEGWNLAIPPVISGIPDPDGALPLSDDALVVVDNSANGAVYKGLALGTRTISSKVQPFLFATNFRTGNIDVFDSNFNQVNVPGSFSDPKVQKGYAPFGIQTINNNLWITFALQNQAKHDPINKPAHGLVGVFDTDGNLLQHFAQHGHLSSPWGVALAPGELRRIRQ